MVIFGSSCLSNIPSVALMTPPPTSNTSTSFAVIYMSPLTKNCAYDTRFIWLGVITFRLIQTPVGCMNLVASVFQSELFQPVAQRAESQAEATGGGGLVPAGFFQGLGQGFAFDVVEEVFQ